MTDSFMVAAGWENDRVIGTCHIERARGNERISFSYDREWLKDHKSFILDPDLLPIEGPQYVTDKPCFGFLSDIAPDRWGRKLMDRQELVDAKNDGRPPRKFMESDYILNVSDRTRQGGLRLVSADNGIMSSSGQDIPPITELRTLEASSVKLEQNDKMVEKWLKQLMAPGSSLGGARPKANIVDTDGSIWIAKFPSKNDDIDVGAWEMVCHDLAKMCGLNVPEAKLMKFSDYGNTFIVKRFDRSNDKRIHFASAMTMLGRTDNDADASYLDIVEQVEKNGKNVADELHELWGRMVFNICVGNTDDHLRNHGFLLDANDTWSLSPVYDVNPHPDNAYLSLIIDGNNNEKSLCLALEVCDFFRMNKECAKMEMKKICDTVSSYRSVLADKYRIPRQEQQYMNDSFSEADRPFFAEEKVFLKSDIDLKKIP